MKTKLSLTFLLSFIFGLLSSQVPQGFNYQAIARDAISGNPITDPIDVKIAILAADASTVIREELHNAVDPDEHGLFNLVVGQGSWESGALNFSDIDWTENPKYIRTSVYYGGSWKVLDPAQLWSVPYAMVADSLGGPLKKLEVEGETDDMEESLFEVRNTEGRIVFAVYNEGVRVYVSDGDIKGPKGGFAIGNIGSLKQGDQNYFFVSGDSIRAYIDSTSVKGVKGGFAIGSFEKTKGETQDYLKVTRDSVRIYLDANPATKGPKGGFAIGGFDYVKGDQNFFNVSMDTLGMVNPSENRILWYPLKNAFRTGKVLIEKRDSVGENSFASGYESKAIGNYSQALGYKAIARGNYSTAIGKNAVANNINSFAFGEDAKAKNNESYAIGRGAVASGYRSFAFGSAGIDSSGAATDVARSVASYSFALGQGAKTNAPGSFAIGLSSSTDGNYSVSIGYKAKTNSYAEGSVAIGKNSFASGINSFAARGTTNADNSLAIGGSTSGVCSSAFGISTAANSYYSTAMGCGNKTYSGVSATSWVETDPLFVIGNGHSISQPFPDPPIWYSNNVLTILKNGNVGIGTDFPNSRLEVLGESIRASRDASQYIEIKDRDASGGSISGISYSTNRKILKIQNLYTPGGSIGGTGNIDFYVGPTNDPWAIMSITDDGKVQVWESLGVQRTAGSVYALYVDGGTSTDYSLRVYKGGYASGNGFVSESDIRKKENIKILENCLERVINIRGVAFNWKKPADSTETYISNRQIGLIAQEVEEEFPELVITDDDGYKGVAYGRVCAVLVEAIKEQQRIIETREQEIASLEERLNNIESYLGLENNK